MSKRKRLSQEETEAIARLHDVMRKFCEDVERRKETERVGRIADELGANV